LIRQKKQVELPGLCRCKASAEKENTRDQVLAQCLGGVNNGSLAPKTMWRVADRAAEQVALNGRPRRD
jgi:hypothetical protein